MEYYRGFHLYEDSDRDTWQSCTCAEIDAEKYPELHKSDMHLNLDTGWENQTLCSYDSYGIKKKIDKFIEVLTDFFDCVYYCHYNDNARAFATTLLNHNIEVKDICVHKCLTNELIFAPVKKEDGTFELKKTKETELTHQFDSEWQEISGKYKGNDFHIIFLNKNKYDFVRDLNLLFCEITVFVWASDGSIKRDWKESRRLSDELAKMLGIYHGTAYAFEQKEKKNEK